MREQIVMRLNKMRILDRAKELRSQLQKLRASLLSMKNKPVVDPQNPQS